MGRRSNHTWAARAARYRRKPREARTYLHRRFWRALAAIDARLDAVARQATTRSFDAGRVRVTTLAGEAP